MFSRIILNDDFLCFPQDGIWAASSTTQQAIQVVVHKIYENLVAALMQSGEEDSSPGMPPNISDDFLKYSATETLFPECKLFPKRRGALISPFSLSQPPRHGCLNSFVFHSFKTAASAVDHICPECQVQTGGRHFGRVVQYAAGAVPAVRKSHLSDAH